MIVPTRQEAADLAGVSLQTLESGYTGRRPTTSYEGRIGDYVKNEVYAAIRSKKFQMLACAGHLERFIPALRKLWPTPFIVTDDSPFVSYQKFYCVQYLMFETDTNFPHCLEFDRPMIAIDCPEQCLFPAINGFDPETSIEIALWMIAHYNDILPHQITKTS